MQVHFLGWCKDSEHDKVWGVVESHDDMVVFWAKRGGKFAFKRDHTESPMAKLVPQKRRKYREISLAEMEQIEPGFEQNLRRSLSVVMLGAKFHNEGRFKKISYK